MNPANTAYKFREPISNMENYEMQRSVAHLPLIRPGAILCIQFWIIDYISNYMYFKIYSQCAWFKHILLGLPTSKSLRVVLQNTPRHT
jgi:hypothetical protein